MITFVLRSGAQIIVGSLVTWLVALGLDVPEQVQTWLLGAIVAAGIIAWSWLIRWLETRHGDTGWPALARGLARLLMLGAGRSRPVYVPPNSQVEAASNAAGTTSAVVGRTSRPPVR